MALLEDFSTTLALCPGRNMIPLEVNRAQTNPGTTRGDSWKSLTDAFGVRARNGNLSTLRRSQGSFVLNKRSRTRLQLVLCDDWHGTPAALLRRI